jgi:competence protein ComFC
MRKIIKSIKYRLAREILDELLIDIKPMDLARILQMKRVLSGALIQPIPLTSHKLKSRGFNQAYLLAKFFSRVLGLEIADFLIRTKDPGAQAEAKSRSQRYRNIRGVFDLRPRVRIKNRRIVLVDDVITTGATINEAARILKSASVDKIYVLTLAGN